MENDEEKKKEKRYTDINDRQAILDLHKQGYNQREIAKMLFFAPSTVNFWINRGGNLEPEKRSGRKRVTTSAQDDLIHSMCTADPFLSAPRIKKVLSLNVNHQTIRNRLIEKGLGSFKKVKKTYLQPRNIQKRFEFALKYQSWTPAQWEKVCFTDEKTFQSFGKGPPRVWRPKLSRWKKEEEQSSSTITRFHESVIFKHKVSGRFSVKIWGCIGKMNILHRIQIKTLNHIYLVDNIFQEYFSSATDFILLQDGSPIHNAGPAKQWLQNHNIEVLDWPGYSPDLNPIENVWGRMEKILDKREPNTEYDLWILIKNTFDELINDKKYIENLVYSMPKRLQEVINVEGNITKY